MEINVRVAQISVKIVLPLLAFTAMKDFIRMEISVYLAQIKIAHNAIHSFATTASPSTI